MLVRQIEPPVESSPVAVNKDLEKKPLSIPPLKSATVPQPQIKKTLQIKMIKNRTVQHQEYES